MANKNTNKKSKDEPLTLIDIANIVSHSGLYKYNDVLNMTVEDALQFFFNFY